MTIELNFDNVKLLKTFSFIISEGLQKFTENVPESYYDECIKTVNSIENVIKPIREALAKQEKYLEYLKLKEIFEPKV